MSETDLRITVNLPPNIAGWLDDYWHQNRLNSRQEAIRELLEYALTHQDAIEAWRALRAKFYRRAAAR